MDADQARRIAMAFADAPRSSADPSIAHAYADLSEQACRWFDRLTGPRGRRPVRVVYTRCAEPYVSAVELAESVRHHRVLELWPVAYDRDRRPPLLDSRIGGPYDRFRAVHDILSHGWLQLGFDRDGEYSAWLAEDRLYRGAARQALATELHGEHSVRWTSGDLADHKAVLLDERLIEASRRDRPPAGHERR